MKPNFLPLIIGLALAVAAPSAEGQTKIHSVYGAAKVTLPQGATLEPFDFGSTKGLQVVLSEKDPSNRVYIERKTVSKSLSDSKWKSGRINYYNKLFKKYKGVMTKKTLRGSGKQVRVEYEYNRKNEHSRDYTKYLRANRSTQIQAYYFAFSSDKKKVESQWKSKEARQLRAVVDSLRAEK